MTEASYDRGRVVKEPDLLGPQEATRQPNSGVLAALPDGSEPFYTKSATISAA